MATILISLILSAASFSDSGGGYYEVGSKADNFTLKNTDGEMVSLSDFEDAKGFVVIFTCNHCPYAQAYQDRIIGLDAEYKEKGYPVIAVNSVPAEEEPRDSYENMVLRAREKGYTFPYLHDADQSVLRKFGAQYTPTAFVLQKTDAGELIVMYIGAIDDNYRDVSAVTVNYVKNALNSIIEGSKPDPEFTKAIGCGIPYSNVAFAGI
jgi:peroxiredoxin